MTKPTKIQEKTLEQLLETIKNDAEAAIQARFEEYTKSFKIKENAMYSAMESLQNSINLMQKEINYKIGGMTARQKREENKVEVFSTLGEAVAKANEIREKAGLTPLDLHQLEAANLGTKAQI